MNAISIKGKNERLIVEKLLHAHATCKRTISI